MKKDKTLGILRQFSQKELQSFLNFAQSPYFNKRQTIVDYVIYLAGFHPQYPEQCIRLDRVPASVFPPNKQTKKELSYLKSRTFNLLKQFICQEQLKEKPTLYELYTAWGLKTYVPTEALSYLNRQKDRYQKLERTDTYDLLFQYLATDILHVQARENTVQHEMLLQESINLLDEFYIINKLIYGIEMQNRRQFVQHTDAFQNPFMEDIEHFLHQLEHFPPRTAIYFQIYLCGKYPNNTDHFDRLVSLLYQHQHDIVTSECRIIYIITINLCIRRMRVNHAYFAPQCLQLYEEGIRTKILFEDGRLSEWTYKNAVKLGLQLQLIDWTEDFIHEHNKYLRPEAQNNALYSNLAELTFVKKEFDLTLDHLTQINTQNFRYYFSTKILLIKTFYETDNIDSCMSAVGSFTVYLSRLKGVSPAVKKNCQHFCQVLYQITSSNSQKKVEKVKNKILTTTPLAERDWLLGVFKREHPRVQLPSK